MDEDGTTSIQGCRWLAFYLPLPPGHPMLPIARKPGVHACHFPLCAFSFRPDSPQFGRPVGPLSPPGCCTPTTAPGTGGGCLAAPPLRGWTDGRGSHPTPYRCRGPDELCDSPAARKAVFRWAARGCADFRVPVPGFRMIGPHTGGGGAFLSGLTPAPQQEACPYPTGSL